MTASGKLEGTQPRKAYRQPSLVRYGNIGEITRNVSIRGMIDNGAKKTRKTG